MNQFQVTLVENNEELGFGQALGITEDRYELISNHMADITVQGGESKDILRKATSIAQTTNELAFICFCLGAQFQAGRTDDPVQRILNAILSNED